MPEIRDATWTAAASLVRGGVPLDRLLTRGDQRRLVRQTRDWYLESQGAATRSGTCVVVTAGPPGAGKSTILPAAVSDLAARLLIDPDEAKTYIARWCVEHGPYDDLLSQTLPDGDPLRPLELSPLLQTMSTEACNAVRRTALADGTDVAIQATMASTAYGERLLQSLAKADYDHLFLVSAETDRDTAHTRAKNRWWTSRHDGELGGRLVLPETIDAVYQVSS
ncbi:MAG: zeta toxin family protein, partial [Micrococcales bacterium]|nr:zeta toxin family protein [Micrococcales bacterium]